jgi:protein SCO1
VRAAAVALGSALAVAAVAAALIAVAGDAHHAAARPALKGPLMPRGARAPAFALRDDSGRRATLAQYRGRVVVLTFLHSLCRGACPIMAQQIRGALDDLGPRAGQVSALAISVDPAQDTPRNIRHFLRVQRVVGTLRYLRGTRRQLAPVWKAYGVQPVGGRDAHTAYVFLIDRDGLERVGYPVGALTPEDLSNDIRVLLAAA